MLRKLYLLFLSVVLSLSASAQVGSGTIKGKLLDQNTGEPVPLANVVAKRNGVVVSGAQTDFDGVYVIKPLEPGRYDVEASFAGFATKRVSGVLVNSDQITYLDIKLSSSVDIKTVEVTGYKVPLIQKDGQSKTTVDREAIQKMPQRGVEAIAATVGGVSTAGTGGEISIRGSRPDGGNFIYIDGIKVRGSSNLPKAALQEITVIPGGLPANYGDVTGGIISITTRGPSSEFNGSLEGVSSGFRSKNGATGLDAFGHNLLEGYISGPIWSRKDADGLKKPILGFSASLNYTSNVDTRPSIVGVNTIRPDVRARLENDLLFNRNGSVGFNVLNLRKSDFVNQRTNSNVNNNVITGNFKLDVATTPTVNLTFGGSFNYENRKVYSFQNQFMNADNNGINNTLDWRAFARFTQRFKSGEESKSNIKNVYYSFMLDYTQEKSETMNAKHRKNFFDYGYVGNFKIYRDTFQYDPSDGYFRQSSTPGDTLVEFTPGDKNPLLARYTSEYFELFNNPDGNYRQLLDITKGGLRNGDAPITVGNGLFANIGTPFGAYRSSDNRQFRISANGSADVGNHAVQVGFEYEQRDDRFFNYNNLVTNENNRANNVWAIARNLVNAHLTELNLMDSVIITVDPNGNPYPIPFVNFARARGVQTTFDRNLRTRLGLDPNGVDIINIDELDPSILSMQDFSSEELLNGGNNRLVDYAGYDHLGNRLRSRPTIDDYFNSRDESGNLLNTIGAYQPIYFAGYIMDKF
ncbi:MAG TPA: carboxypeptidase regulatory-like domain-containing protein, partial [Luteibaculaceae bacterium]|nr:carboxypeptidase regulatory-like domain-containing protein [Luteibaculaceae bacterium]